MEVIYRARASELLDAIAALKITTAQGLADQTGISRNTASKVLSGKSVSIATAVSITNGLNKAGAVGSDRSEYKPSDLFRAIERHNAGGSEGGAKR